MRHELSRQPTAISGLADDTVYLLQNRGCTPVLVERAGAAPDAGGGGAYELLQREFLALEKASGLEIFAWQQSGGELGFLAYDERA